MNVYAYRTDRTGNPFLDRSRVLVASDVGYIKVAGCQGERWKSAIKSVKRVFAASSPQIYLDRFHFYECLQLN